MSMFAMRMIEGADRPALASFVPTARGESVMLDLGANIECDADNLAQFAVMGSVFAQVLMGLDAPRVGLLNVGSEELKGHEELRQAAACLRREGVPISFQGFIEGNDITSGAVDVVVTDGFTGNIALKSIEGTAKLYTGFVRDAFRTSTFAKIGYLFASGALEKMRKRVEADLKKRTLSRDTVLAAVVRLLDTQHIRIGNEQYAKSNKSFGATTLRNRHLVKKGNKLRMKFTGKHGIVHEVAITDANLKRIVAKCQDLPGQNLFQYVGDDGEPHAVTSADVNDYIRETSGAEFTAKGFRTWGASVIAFEQMLGSEEGERLSVKTMVEPVAEALGNTVAMSRKSYVHPRLIDAVREAPRDALEGLKRPPGRRWLSSAEVGLIAYLKSKPKRRTTAKA